MNLKFLFGAGLMLASGLAITGCSSDNNPDGPDKIMEAGSKFYVRVAIANANEATRADDYQDNTVENNYTPGEKGENDVKKVLFVFYNADGGYVAQKEMDIKQSDHNSGNIESLVDIVVPVTVNTQAKVPAYVVAYVNPTIQATQQNASGTLQTIQGNRRTLQEVLPSAYNGTNANGFLMTNSVYYQTGIEAPVVGAPVPPKALYEKAEDAEAEDAEGITIYVERTMAKVTVNKNLTDGKQGTITDEMPEVVTPDGQTTYKLDFKELAWGLNNEEKNTYVLKNFRTGTENNTGNITNMSLNAANLAMTSLTAPTWNYPADDTNVDKGRRSFWAYSPYYFNKPGIYPEFSDQIDSKINENPIESPLYQTKFSEIYDVKKNSIGEKGYAFGAVAYTLENTVEDAVYREANAADRAVTSALIVGKYRVLDSEDEEVEYDNIYIRRDDKTNIIYVNNWFMMQKFLETQTVTDGLLYTKNAPNATPEYSPVSWAEENKATIEHDFEIVHPFKTVTGVWTASRYVTLQLRSDATLTRMEGEGEDAKTVPVYYYRDSNGIMTAVTSDNLLTVNSSFYQFLNGKLGGVEMFNSGYAYFKVPIRHLWGRSKKGFGDTNATDEGFTLGQYGIVRNHIYNINVQAISGIGTGISSPDAPIVFPVTTKEYHVKTVIRVQKWRIVPQQDVTLKP